MNSNMIIIVLSLVIPLTIAYIYLFRKQSKKETSHGRPIPSPPALPILEHSLLAGKYLSSPKSHEYIVQLHKEYGPFVAFKLPPGASIVFVSDGQFIRRAWVSSEFCRNEVMQVLAGDFFGSAVSFLPTGTVWHRHRKMLQPAFYPANLRYATKSSQEAFGSLLHAWSSKLQITDKKEIEVDLSGGLKAALLDAIGSTLYSYQFEAVKAFLNDQECKGSQPIWNILHILQKRVGLPPFLWFLNGSSPSGSESMKARNELYAFIGDIIEKKKRRLASMSLTPDKMDLDIVDRLLLESQNGELLTDSEVMDETAGLFLASFENVFRSIESTLAEILSRPQVLDRILRELDTILPMCEKPFISMADLSKFVYVENVIKESLRFNPSVGWLPRAAATQIEYDGYQFPRDTLFMLSLVASNRDPNYWKNPDEFNPDRFLNSEECTTFIPFGDGPTNCIGQRLAWIQMKLFIIQIFSTFDLKLVPGPTFERVTALTTGLKNPIHVHLSNRCE